MTREARAPIIAAAEEGKTVSLGPNRVAFLLRADQTGGRYSLTEFTLAPPPAPGPPMHVHETEDELTYVLEGELEFALEGRSKRASAGSFFLVPKGTTHTLRNLGPGAARILVLLTPPGRHQFLPVHVLLPSFAHSLAQISATFSGRGFLGLRTTSTLNPIISSTHFLPLPC
jgi:quercetin dioxygenase-like cupin family protein